ncbi:hypothetical protein L9F63_013598 [Diploptera punctata]|uniref:Uncharacterized protein n=1 Tax=Diploptera punctata TaxID=6984 RepID=A0AAD8ELY4_DIPPU|nr:hypothetical protein L9F63_013598 [Diploptera punctata]
MTVKVLEKYVKNIMKQSVELKHSNPLQNTCEYLQHLLSSVPPVMLYELRIRVLRHIESTYNTMLKTCSTNSGFQEVAIEIFSTILYPLVDKVEFAKFSDCDSHLDELYLFKMKSRWLFDIAQPKLKNLRTLDIRFDLIGFFEFKSVIESELYQNFSRIEELTCNRLAWKKMNNLIHHCKNLKRFNFDGALKPYDVPFILKITTLEELKFHTRCNDRVTELLVGLSQTKRPDGLYISQNIKKLGKIWPSVNDIQLISVNFKNLTSLSLVSCNCDLSPLHTLKNLTDLSIQSTAFRYLENFLIAVGKQLDCLELSDVHDLDLNHIIENCISLRCFHLRYRNPLSTILCNKNIQLDTSKIEIPNFPSVEYLQLKFPSEYPLLDNFLIKFPNIRKLDLVYFQINEISEDLIHVKLKPMKKLEVAFVRCLEDDLMFLVQFFEEHVMITNIEQSKLLFYSMPI